MAIEAGDEALSVAKQFLDRKRVTDPNGWSGLSLAADPSQSLVTFWWCGTIPLYEVPLVKTSTRQSAGYLLISSTSELPPVLEYSTDGLPLSQQVMQLIHPAAAASNFDAKVSRFVFITSTEIYVEIAEPGKGGLVALNVPDLFAFRPGNPIKVSTKPQDVFDPAIVKSQWDILTPGAPGDQPELVLTNAIPVRYQQNCERYALACQIKFDSNDSYCAPNAIAGCVAVAWAMLLSAWKRTGYFGAGNIWNGVNCWHIEWPSWGSISDPSQCAQVNQTIWRLRQHLGTTPGGNTNDTATINGSAIFGEMGLGWRFAQARNQPFEFAIKVLQAGQPMLWTANGIWNVATGQLASTPVPGGVGHAVVAYGYKKADRTLLIALGWGYGFANKYINYDQYRITNCLYVTGVSVAASREEILEMP